MISDAKTHFSRKCTQDMSIAVQNGDPEAAIEAAKYADNIQVRILEGIFVTCAVEPFLI